MTEEAVKNFNITAPPSQLSLEERILHEGRTNLLVFGKYFLQGDFRKNKPSPAHTIMGRSLTDENVKYVANIIARGHAKTTLTKALILNKFLYYSYDYPNVKTPPPFYVWIADSLDKSFSNMDYIEKQALYNSNVIRVFGKIDGKTHRRKWNEHYKEFRDGQCLVARSNIKNTRGETKANVFGGTERIHAAIFDDVENEENTKTADSRKYIKNIFTDSVYPALDPKYGRIIFNGTPVHADSLCADILKAGRSGYTIELANGEETVRPIWHMNVFPATQPNMEGGVLWHDRFPKEKLEEIRNWYIQLRGNDAGYYQEYELQVRQSSFSIWTKECINYHDARPLYDPTTRQTFVSWKNTFTPANFYVGCDPATDITNEWTDFSAISIVAYLYTREVLLMEYMLEKALPAVALRSKDGQVIGKLGVLDHIIRLHDLYNSKLIVVEDVGMTRGIFQEFNQWRMDHPGRHDVRIFPEQPGGREKLNKIKTGLNPIISLGNLYIRREHAEMRDQILGFGPGMRHDDLIESLFFATRYMTPPPNVEFNSRVSRFKSMITHPSSWKGSQRITP